jgi:hypothetical protein
LPLPCRELRMVLAYLTELGTLCSGSMVALERLTNGIQQLHIVNRLGKKRTPTQATLHAHCEGRRLCFNL